MTCRMTGVALLLAILPTVGCGTVANLARPGPEAGGKAPFGGVSHDMCCIRRAADGEFNTGADHSLTSGQLVQAVKVVLYALDLPLSLIADVVTWPYVVAYSVVNEPVPVPPVILATPPGPRVTVTTAPPGVTAALERPPVVIPDATPAAGR